MTDKITLELTLDELKLIDKYVELNDETESVFDKIKYAYPQPKMTLQQEGEYAVVSYHDKVYYRLMGETTYTWYIKKGVSAIHPVPTLVMVDDAETERLLDGLYYNHVVVKKEKEQRTKTTPVEEAYKDWWGIYPELENDTEYDVTRWQGFQAGYHFAYEEKVAQEPEDTVWKSVALKLGESLSDVGPDGYYEFSADEWFEWAIDECLTNEVKRLQEKNRNVVRESVKWCEENPDKDPLDWVKPQTPEQVADGLKEAFREAVKQGVVSSTKSKTLTDLIYDWWADVFTTHSDWDMETSIEDLVDQIELFLPKEQSAAGSQNVYVECTVEGFNDCLNKIKGKLR